MQRIRMQNRAVILIVDDMPQNVGVLFDFLIKQGFKVLIAEDGKRALQVVYSKKPDLILLDIMMPEMDGFTVCEQLKTDTQTAHIPIIFMTALTDTEEKVKGFSSGAVDYVTKPFHQEEVLARINSHLTISALQRELEAKNAQLMQLNQEKDEFLGIAAHDLKNPLSTIQGMAQFIENALPDLSTSQIAKYIHLIESSSKQMFNLISNLLDVNALELGKIDVCLVEVDLLPILSMLVNNHAVAAQAKQISLEFFYEETGYITYIDENLIQQVFDNLLSNAIKYSPLEKTVYVNLLKTNRIVRCEIQDEGVGLTQQEQALLFKKFSRLSSRPTAGEHSTGLGLFIVKKMVELMNGKVWCESESGRGSTFIVEFPAVKSESI